jgi:hypothetical protein
VERHVVPVAPRWLAVHRRVTVVSEGSSAWLLATARVDALTSLQASSDPYG